MKAKDLAALGALGLAGYAAYNKFGKKDDETKTRGKLGESQSANDGTAGEYRSDMLGKGRSANEGDAGESEARMSKRSRQENDVPDRIMGKDAAGSRFTDRDVDSEGIRYDYIPPREKAKETFVRPTAAGGNSKTPVARSRPVSGEDLSNEGRNSRRPTVVTMPTGDDRFVTPEEGAKAYKPRRTPGAADGVGSTSSSSEEGMANYVPRRTVPAATSSSTEEGMANYVPRRTLPTATSSSTEEGMAAYVPRRYNPAADSNAAGSTSSSTAAGMGANVPRRPAVASSTAAGMTAYVPRNTAAVEQARLDALRSSGGRRAAGGVVKKMASGGLASSRMSSKPKQSTASSRGDGIAQRGKTRGQMR
jgi:hypothetical protein